MGEEEGVVENVCAASRVNPTEVRRGWSRLDVVRASFGAWPRVGRRRCRF